MGRNDAKQGRKLLKWCKLWLEIAENSTEMMQICSNLEMAQIDAKQMWREPPQHC